MTFFLCLIIVFFCFSEDFFFSPRTDKSEASFLPAELFPRYFVPISREFAKCPLFTLNNTSEMAFTCPTDKLSSTEFI
jgi:hypothetical protein